MKEFKKILLIAIMTMLVNTSFSYGNINNEEDLILKENLDTFIISLLNLLMHLMYTHFYHNHF